ncbi:MAG: DEAD/DEAH box helicase [Nitrososphaerales archaeon]
MNEQEQKQQVAAIGTGKGFDTLNIHPEVLKSLREIGYKEMFPIQAAAIPPLMEGKDVLGQAHTGSGKTAAYALPILQKINATKRYVQALVVVPTRELALQVTDEFNKISKYIEVKAYAIYGGQAITPQIERLRRKTPQIVVATPGRLIDHIERGTIDLQDVQTVILDEADRMLDMGFIDDVDYIMRQLPNNSQTALFSATMPNEIMRLSHKYMNKPVEVLIDNDELSVEEIDQKYAMVDERSKFAALAEYIRKNGIATGIVFCATKIKTQKLSERLQAQGFKAAPIHGDLSQNQREHAMRNFRSGYIELLIATDVAARGIDVPAVSHVINYDVPMDPLTYFHRIGRTARAGKAGKALTLVSSGEYPDFSRIAGMTEVEIKRITDILPEGYHPQNDSRDSSPRQFGQRRFGGDHHRPGGRPNFRREGGPSPQRENRGSGFSFTENVASHSERPFRPSFRPGQGSRDTRPGGSHEREQPQGDRPSAPYRPQRNFNRQRRRQ